MSAWTVEPGYEPVREAFEQRASAFGRGGGAYCAYVDGKPVVDLWAGSAQPGVPWQAETRTVIMSASKGLASLCLQILEDRGQLDIDAVRASADRVEWRPSLPMLYRVIAEFENRERK